MTGKTIQIENVGPIERLSIPLPEAGVVVLRGRNGVGKSHALQAVDSLVGGRGRPPCRDGARRAVVEGFGARITISRSLRRTGEAEVTTLEGRLDISQLVQPPLKDQEAADRQRIKALIQLSGQPADPKSFESILPEGLSLGELVSPSERDDPVVLAGKVKRALEAEARRHEKASEDAAAKAAALEEQLPEQIPDGDPDEAEKRLQAALLRQRELEVQAQQARTQREQIQKAQAELDKLRQSRPASSAAELKEQLGQLDEKIRKLQQALAVAQERRQQLARQLEAAQSAEEQIRRLESLIQELPQEVPQQQLQQVRQEVESLRRQYDAARQAKQLRQLAAQAKSHREVARKQSRLAERLRDAARSTDEVLTGLVSQVTQKLRVEAGRLVCDTDRGVEPFAELSPGERWRIALEIAAEQVGPGGLVTVPQEAWEALDPVHREEVAEIARRVGVVILTAEAAENEEISAEVLPGANPHHREAEAAFSRNQK